MNIETTIKRMFEKEIEQCQTPECPSAAIPVHTGKRKKEGYGALLVCLLMTSALAALSLKTGVVQSPAVEWAGIATVMPEDFITAFSDWLYLAHSSF